MAKKSTTTKTIKGTNPDNLPEVKSSVKSLKTQVAAKADSKAPTKEELQALKVKTAEAEAAKAKAAEAAQAAETTAASSKQAVAATGAEAGAKAAVAADSAATMAGSSASASSAGAGAASSTAASSKAAAASPWAVGAGILGVAAVAAAASGGSSGGSSTPAPQATTPPVADAVNQAQNQQDQVQGQQGSSNSSNASGANGDAGAGTGTGTGNSGSNQNTTTPTGPAAAGGTAAAPLVTPTGITNLKAESFAGTAEAAQQPQFLKIVNIFSQERAFTEPYDAKAGEAGARVIRFGDAAATPRAEGDEAPAAAAKPNTAYEVIEADKPLTRAEAEEMAKALGGKLMVIDDAVELGWAKQNLTRLLGGYEGSAAKTAGAWVGTSTVEGAKDLDALIRKEDNTNPESEFFKSAADQKFSRFVVEFNDYKSPLLLDGKPVFEGQVITAADYAKLSWDSTQNKFGRIFVRPATGLNDERALNQLTPEELGTVRPINLSESADVKPGSAAPANPASNGSNDASADAGNAANTGNGGSQPGGTGNTGSQTAPNAGVYDADNAMEVTVGHDASTPLSASFFKGNEDAKAPQFVKITSIVPSDAATDAPALYFETAEGAKAIFNDAGHILNASLFDKISWNSTGNTGGTFTFVAVADANGTAIPGAKEQTVTVTEAAAPTPPAQQQPGEGSDTTVPGAPTGGQEPGTPGSGETQQTPPSDQPGTGQNQGGSSGSDTTQQPPSGQQPPAQGGDASSGQQTQPGGSQNADSQQTDTSKLPTYESNKSVAYAHDESKAIGAAVFNGTNEANKPQFVQITAILNKEGAAAAAETMKLDGGKAIALNDVIAQADFAKIVWDASKGEDGSFKFKPVADANGGELAGASEQTITIEEADAPPVVDNKPVYDPSKMTVAFNHNDANLVGAEVFTGTDRQKAPQFVKITEILKADGSKAAEGTLKIQNGANIAEGNVIAADDFGKVVWDASKDGQDDGSFKFQPVTSQEGNTIVAGSTEQTVTINEADAPPPPAVEVHQPAAGAVSVAADSEAAPVDKAQFGDSVKGEASPAFVKIENVTLTADEHKTRATQQHQGTAYEVFTVEAGLTRAEAEAAARKLGGTLLKLDSAEEVEFVKTSLLSKLGGTSDGSDAAKAAWMLAADSAVEGAADKEALYDNNGEVAYADRDTAETDKLNNFIVEYADYANKPSGLMLDGAKVDNGKVLSAEDQGKLTWNSLFNNGGSIQFVAVTDETGNTKAEGAASKVINVTEQAATEAAPVAKSLDSLLSDELQQHTPLI